MRRRVNGRTRTKKRIPMPANKSRRDFRRNSSVDPANDFTRYVMRGGVRL